MAMSAWTSLDDGRSYETTGGDGEAWIRYQHFFPAVADWREIELRGKAPRIAVAAPDHRFLQL